VTVDGSVQASCDFVLRSVEDRGVRFVRLWFVDVLGNLKSMAIPVSELEGALEDGVGVDGSSLEGSVRLAERDVIAHPDPLTFQILPWRPGSLVARMFCEVRGPDGRPFPGDSRLALARMVRQAAELGFTFEVGSEIEFFLYAGVDPPGREHEDPQPVPLDQGAYFDLTALDVGSDFRRRTIEYLEQMGIPVKSAHHEVAASQHELDLQHTDAMSMADALMTFRLAVKEAARTVGCYATFMPQPVEGQPGSGMHLHLSLFDADGNAFFSPEPGQPLSPLGRAFLAGLLAHGPELCAVTNQWVNSYKRLANGHEAPQHVSWTRHGRSALVRVPAPRRHRPQAARIELRSPDPAANPYLVFALVLAAGLRGIERGYELEAETVDEPAPGTRRLPQDLDEATDLFERSDLARETLGDRLCDWYVLNKRREWADYRTTVSPFERRRYLRL
jgi:glutamine synthetase